MSFRLQVILRILWILLFGYAAFLVSILYPAYYLLIGWFTLFAILGVVLLIRYIEKSHRAMGQFLLSIKQKDFSTTYVKQTDLSTEMTKAFELITGSFKELRNEKESSHHFLKTVVEHSGVPLISFGESDLKVKMINEAAKELFKIPHLTSLTSLNKVQDQLANQLAEIPDQHKILLNISIKKNRRQLSVWMKKMVIQGEVVSLIALHDIESELDQKEIESWQKLIRVMTHEIKNSVIPISTLSEVLHTMINSEDGGEKKLSELDAEDQEDLRIGIKTIEKRSKGLVSFVSSYGDLAKVPRPTIETHDLKEVIQDVLNLEKEELKKRKIAPSLHLPKVKVNSKIDLQMIEQVLINLIKNSIEALETKENAILDVTLTQQSNGVQIILRDNGPGMDKETLNNVFIPFYSTKEKGSGIGLPLSRQIIRAHGGQLKVESEPGLGTTVTILLQ